MIQKILLFLRFKPFEEFHKDIFQLFDTWDRTIGTTAIPDGEKNDTDIEIPVAPSVSMNKKTDTKKVEKERLKEVQHVFLMVCTCCT